MKKPHPSNRVGLFAYYCLYKTMASSAKSIGYNFVVSVVTKFVARTQCREEILLLLGDLSFSNLIQSFAIDT